MATQVNKNVPSNFIQRNILANDAENVRKIMQKSAELAGPDKGFFTRHIGPAVCSLGAAAGNVSNIFLYGVGAPVKFAAKLVDLKGSEALGELGRGLKNAARSLVATAIVIAALVIGILFPKVHVKIRPDNAPLTPAQMNQVLVQKQKAEIQSLKTSLLTEQNAKSTSEQKLENAKLEFNNEKKMAEISQKKLQERIVQLENQLKGVPVEVSTHSVEDIRSMEREIKQLREQLEEEINSGVDAAAEELVAKDEEINDLKEAIEKKEQMISTYRKEIEDRSSRIRELENKDGFQAAFDAAAAANPFLSQSLIDLSNKSSSENLISFPDDASLPLAPQPTQVDLLRQTNEEQSKTIEGQKLELQLKQNQLAQQEKEYKVAQEQLVRHLDIATAIIHKNQLGQQFDDAIGNPQATQDKTITQEMPTIVPNNSENDNSEQTALMGNGMSNGKKPNFFVSLLNNIVNGSSK